MDSFSPETSAAESPFRRRLPLACPIRLFRSGSEAARATTEDINCEGFSFLAPSEYPAGEILDGEVAVPEGSPSRARGWVILRCKVRILAASPRESGRFLIACGLLSYSVEGRHTAQWAF